MFNDYRMVGICITRMEDETCRLFLDEMQQQAEREHTRLFVFNSFLDFYYGNEQEQGAKAVYEMINYELLDALVIVDQRFYDKELVRHIISSAQKHHTPVIVLNAAYDGCYSIMRSCTEAFSALIGHVLEAHAPQTVGYIAGSAERRHTRERLAIYREAMAAHGREVDETMIAYCDDWTEPVCRTIDQWYAEGRIPQAIICASDLMAAAACDQLELHGLHVPQDVMVTGFDGLESLFLHTPRLTTCIENVRDRVRLIFEMTSHAMQGGQPYAAEEQYLLRISESCCHMQEEEENIRVSAHTLFRALDDHLHHEQSIYSSADNLLRSSEPHMAVRVLQQSLLPGSALVLNQDVLFHPEQLTVTLQHPFTSQMIVIDAVERRSAPQPTHRMNLGDMFPGLADVIAQNTIFCFTAIALGEQAIGYYAARMDQIISDPYKVRRLCRVLNLEFSVLLNRIRREYMATLIKTVDPLTGLMNHKGLAAYMDEHYEELRGLHLAVSSYSIITYQHMLEEHGTACVEQAAVTVAELLRKDQPPHTLIARLSAGDFIAISYGESSEEVRQAVGHATAAFYEGLERYNANLTGSKPLLEVQCGSVALLPGWENDLASLIRAASGEMYLNRIKTDQQTGHDAASDEQDSQQQFRQLLEQNLFYYHFQPIVNAHTGEIVGYEALMRTREPVHMQPAQVLDLAGQLRRLYDIERATMFNVLDYVNTHEALFDGKRVFINTIPGYFLNETDKALLTQRYSHLFGSVTVEITETGVPDDAELKSIRRLAHNGSSFQLAIDDYGTGFSNIVNLLRYQPQVIKIDRYLVENVHRDPNKQLFIRSTVEFARLNGILVLAEGVETRAELSKVIELGVDLVQGYYVARPAEQVATQVSDELKHLMIEENLRFSRFGMQEKVYHAESGERLDLLQLAMEKYTAIELRQGSCTVTGQPDHYINMPIFSAPGASVQLYLENVYISAQGPAVTVGEQGSMVLMISGRNGFDQEGVHVPPSASLLMGGEGSLTITNLQQKGVVLGANEDEAFGHIRVDMTGQLLLHAESETSICIGGGRKSGSAPIELISGDVQLVAKGVHSVAVGSLSGDVNVVLGPRVSVHAEVIGNEAVGVGTLAGSVDITNNARIDMTIEGERITGIGALGRGEGCVRMGGSFTRIVAHGAYAVGVGSLMGEVDVVCSAELMSLYMEGQRTCGLGCLQSAGKTSIIGGAVTGSILSAEPIYLGCNAVITSGCVDFRSEQARRQIHAVNAYGEPLVPVVLDGADTLSLQVGEGDSAYIYRAVRPVGADLCVYLPEHAVEQAHNQM